MEITDTEIPWFGGIVANEADSVASPFARRPRRSRRRFQRRLAKAQERLALLTSMSSLGFWRWSRATDVVWADKHARSILGLDARTLLTRDLLVATIHPADRAQVMHAIAGTTSHGDAVEMELRVLGQDGEIRWITARARAYRDANGMILRVVGYVVDDSNRKRAEAQSLKQQQQITHLTRVAMLGELSTALAHELQQPLTAILCNAQAAQLLATKADFNGQDLREILADIVSEDKHASQIIQRLRSLLTRGEVQLQHVEIGDLLRNVLALCRGTLKERRVQIDLHIDAGIPDVLGDRVELQQVLLNLILNASESMSGNAPTDRRIEIAITLDAAHGTVCISVVDCGKGIEEDQLERVFEPFFTTKASGLGLGLAVCKSIILAHKGRLWATNNSDGGAAFHFTVPVTSSGALPLSTEGTGYELP
jgi:PAS domain S-box-containing protein